MRSHKATIAAGAVFAVQHALGAGPLQIPFSTDRLTNSDSVPATYGPDGPWQAALVQIGSSSASANGVFAPFWPSGSYLVQVLDGVAPGNYTTKDSKSAVGTRTSLGQSDSWWSDAFMNSTFEAKGFFDQVTLTGKTGDSSSKVNASVAAATKWTVPAAQGATYTPSVGILGLGPDTRAGPGDKSGAHDSILKQLQSRGSIPSQSFSMHLGSVAHSLPGSLLLGGYEDNRVIAPVATLRMQAGLHTAFLVDVTLGVEVGGSPWSDNGSVPGSVYAGNDGAPRAVELVKQLGGAAGASLVTLNAADPYMYLPASTCREAAKHLPVTWDERLQLYLWNTGDPQYGRIVKSPAYLGLVVSDKDAQNVTIKVPFALLNLTLERPLVDAPTPYFPCKPYDGDTLGFWQLGRAFLQSAFVAVDFDANATYLAQAPGPNLFQSVTRPINAGHGAASFLAKPPSEFARSWNGKWEVLMLNGNSMGTGGSSGLSPGGIAGVVIAAVAVVALIGFCIWRRKRGSRKVAPALPPRGSAPMVSAGGPMHEYYTPNGGAGELDGRSAPVHEMDGSSSNGTHEAPANPVYELPHTHTDNRPNH
ncbi:uncharacterized protein E0L32_001708 [Thyridium curvatum]|uniref:Peptidase A1 domain-containing protein n=1 Tax=Thyridium curvatum TaxID=1093900 RepID=A0A507AWP5_9PEZI|nr:uncharacterized protein E0L32_001491 [Thyridium curvatum]XP_030990959.1 uncharacterized protein E0L32_001708 [Thyridium curvatum]TPX09031.1 hypothetical protein E0L32_001491 [Thyridium curvatum]TPX09248.1 hypothetical protein E0L32_001708 [Thyridium curvatum]